LPACKELGIAFVAYSPLGRGFLSGRIKTIEDLEEDDYRRTSPRFQGENFNKNLELVKKIEAIAKEKGCTPSAVSTCMGNGAGRFYFPYTRNKAKKICRRKYKSG